MSNYSHPYRRPKSKRGVDLGPPPESQDKDKYMMVLTRSSWTWPKHWRKTIYRVEQSSVPEQVGWVVRVYPRNPDYDFDTANSPHHDPIDFQSLDDMDNWALMVARLTE